jgi:tight adherence protein B
MQAVLQAGLVFGDSGLSQGGISLLLGLLVGGGIALLFVGLQRVIDGRTASGLDRINFAPVVPPVAEARRGRRRQRQAPNPYDLPDKAAGNRGRAKLTRDLARADLKITVGEFWVIRLTLSSVGLLLGIALPIGGRVVLAGALCVAGFVLPRSYVTRQRNKRQQKFNDQLPEMVTILSSAMRSGLALLQAMELVAREGPDPVNHEFERVVREVGLGLAPEEALSNLVERMQSEDLELLVTAINVQREVGGNLAEVLDTIASTIRERVKLLGQVRVLTAQQSFSGYIIALLPVGLTLILTIINPNYILGVFRTTTWCGWTMLTCSVISIFSGFLVIRRIVDITV